MENDDSPAGQILSRREALKLLGVGSAALLAACAVPEGIYSSGQADGLAISSALNCVVRPELTTGPYFVDDQLNRSDIRYDPLEDNFAKGMPLTLKLNVLNASRNSCAPLKAAQVDIWHCNALGIYSGVSERGFNTVGQKFLRGYQITDANGGVQFQTIYPGWYSGRTVHIHFMIRTKAPDGQDYAFTSQLFFDDRLTDIVHARKPYARKGERNTRNAEDTLYKSVGRQLLLSVRGDNVNGYIATINIGLDLTDAEVGKPDIFQ